MVEGKNYKDFTILIQGKLNQDSINYYEKYIDFFPIVISTWVDNKINLENLQNKTTILKSEYPKEKGTQNFYYQLYSTLNGLKFVNTPYVIKVRGDEYYNIFKLVNEVKEIKKYVYTTPVFFRPFSIYSYHISDHLICGKTEFIYNMFRIALEKYNYQPLGENSCEPGLTKAFMIFKGFKEFDNLQVGKDMMGELFKIITLDNLEPYKVVVNAFKKVWYSEDEKFIPHENNSIDNLDKL